MVTAGVQRVAPEQPTAIALVPSPGELSEQAQAINEAHRRATLAANDAVLHAWEAGRLLSLVHDGLDHGEWLPWLEANFEASERTARRYVELFDRVGPNRPTLSDFTGGGYLRLLGSPDRASSEPGDKTSAPVSFRLRDITITRVSRLAVCRGRSQTIVVEDSVQLYEELWDHRQRGAEILIREPDGKESRVLL